MGYAAAMALLLLIGLLLGASLFVYAAYALTAVFFISRFLASRWSESIVAERQLNLTEVEIDQPVTIGIKLSNRSGWFVPWMLIEDYLSKRSTRQPPIAIEVQGSPIRLLMLPGKSQRLITYTVIPRRRGFFQVGPTIAETGDLLGLHRQYRVIAEPQYLLVLPKIIPLQGYEIASKRPVGEIQVTYRLMEDPTLISGIREYQQGDPLSRVHWRATARTGKLHSKVFQPTSVAGAMVVVDLHRDSNPDRHEPLRTDLAITATVSICHTLYQMQQQFGLITNGRDSADKIRFEGWEGDHRTREEAMQSVREATEDNRLKPIVLPAGRGPDHFHELHQTAARLIRTDGLPLSKVLIETQSRLPRDASVIVIVQEVTEETALSLGLFRRQGFAVSAIVNHFEQQAVLEAASRLMAQRIPVFHLHDEQSIHQICRSLILKW